MYLMVENITFLNIAVTILEIDEMSAVSLRVHSAEFHDVGGLVDTPKNDIHAVVSDRWLAGKYLFADRE
jgi:hypothetical protein